MVYIILLIFLLGGCVSTADNLTVGENTSTTSPFANIPSTTTFNSTFDKYGYFRLPEEEKDYKIKFFVKNKKLVGVLTLHKDSGEMTFKGNAKKSAQVFFDQIIKIHRAYQENKCNGGVK